MAWLLEWNLNGLFNNLEELKLIVANRKPSIMCLQETHLKGNVSYNLKHFTAYYRNRADNRKASGGVATFVSNSIPSKVIPITTTLEAIAVEIQHPLKLNICNVYLPGDQQITCEDLSMLLDQIPYPRIVLGDFNAHNIMWGSNHTDKRGRTVEDLMDSHSLLLLNTGDSTRFNAFNGNFTAIDLAFCSASLFPKLSWYTDEHLSGSDHLPIYIDLPLRDFNEPSPETCCLGWNIKKAKWQHFSDDIDNNLVPIRSDQDINEVLSNFTSVLTAAARKYIGKITAPRSRNTPWWNDECREAIRRSKHAFNRLKRHNSNENLMIFKQYRARARYIVKKSKKESWISYVSTINSTTPLSQIWRKVKTMRSCSTSSRIPYLKIDGNVLTADDDLLEVFRSNFESSSSDENYEEEFLRYRSSREEGFQDLFPSNSEPVNSLITFEELNDALGSTKDSSPGPDGIPVVFLKRMSDRAKHHLLQIFNKVWNEHCFPDLWHEAHIVPVQKPNKPKGEASSYRPISLTCSSCKILEKIINRRLIWVLEQRNLLEANQNGFRPCHSTMDSLTKLESDIHESFLHQQKLVAVFCDMSKAYDLTWRSAIVVRMQQWGFGGHIMAFVRNFLQNRSFRIKANGRLSRIGQLQNGVPQGSVISVTLFLIAVNDVGNSIDLPVKFSIYADDLVVYMNGKNLNWIHKMLQSTLDELTKWSQRSGLRFSPEKTKFIMFSKRAVPPFPALVLAGQDIERVSETRFLGVVFDRALTWRDHIGYLRKSCDKVLVLMRALSSYNWGADFKSLLLLYRSLIRAKIDYGSIVYSTASNRSLKLVDTIQHNALRIVSGAYRTSPVASLHCLCQEMPLQLRRNQLTMTYAIGILRNLNHPNYSLVDHEKYHPTFQNVSFQKLPLYARLDRIMLLNSIPRTKLSAQAPATFFPWQSPTLNILDTLSLFKKSETHPEIIRNSFRAIIGKYPDYEAVFTDASKTEYGVGAAVVFPGSSVKYRLPSTCSVFTGELFAISQCLRQALQNPPKKYLICSDSLSSLFAIKQLYPSDPMVSEIHHQLSMFPESAKHLTFVYVPSHVGIDGNELADNAAKEASQLPEDSCLEVYTHMDAKSSVKKLLRNVWNNQWSNSNGNLKAIVDTIYHRLPLPPPRFLQVVLSRLRLGHTKLTHQHLLKHEDPPTCFACDTILTVEHVIIDCPLYQEERELLEVPNKLEDALGENLDSTIRTLNYLKHTGLLNKL